MQQPWVIPVLLLTQLEILSKVNVYLLFTKHNDGYEVDAG